VRDLDEHNSEREPSKRDEDLHEERRDRTRSQQRVEARAARRRVELSDQTMERASPWSRLTYLPVVPHTAAVYRFSRIILSDTHRTPVPYDPRSPNVDEFQPQKATTVPLHVSLPNQGLTESLVHTHTTITVLTALPAAQADREHPNKRLALQSGRLDPSSRVSPNVIVRRNSNESRIVE